MVEIYRNKLICGTVVIRISIFMFLCERTIGAYRYDICTSLQSAVHNFVSVSFIVQRVTVGKKYSFVFYDCAVCMVMPAEDSLDTVHIITQYFKSFVLLCGRNLSVIYSTETYLFFGPASFDKFGVLGIGIWNKSGYFSFVIFCFC